MFRTDTCMHPIINCALAHTDHSNDAGKSYYELQMDKSFTGIRDGLHRGVVFLTTISLHTNLEQIIF